jgi:TolB-like protein/Tfp pilus assembly protein PilF
MTGQEVKRKLTAIMSADVKGYSRLMEEDEKGTVRTLNAYREVMANRIQQHHGRVVDAPGDNVLAEFASIVDAVECAVEIQKELKTRNAELPENRRMEFRIGINLGDVIEEGERIYGDGINIAARIESLSEAGDVCISGSAFDFVGKKLPLGYEYLGEHRVKNIEKAIRVYRVLMEPNEAGKVIGEERLKPKHFPDKLSIAVLPFVNMSGDPEQEYFSDGITEELITALTKLGGLKVISRTSTFCFKGKGVDLRAIGKKLNVKNVLEGSVRKAGNQLRISVQLIDVDDDTHVWAETFNRELKDVFAVQEDISQAIVTKFKVQLIDKGDRRTLVQSSTENPQSQDLYFKGLFSWNKREPIKAIEYLEQSIALDPRNARAYALLATIYAFMTISTPYPPKESYGKAKVAAMKALEIDNRLADAHVAVGVVKMAYEYDWVGAEEALIRAIRLNAGLGSAHHYYAWHQFSVGHIDEAIAEMKRVLEIDPLSTPFNAFMGLGLTMARQYDQAIQYCQRALEITPNDPSAMANLGLAYAKKGMCEEAISILQKGANLFPENPFLVSALGFSYGVTGKKDEAKKIISGFMEISKKKYFSPMFISRVYAGMGEVDKAIEWMEKAYEERDPAFSLIKSVPSHDYMHSDPRFRALLKKMGLED